MSVNYIFIARQGPVSPYGAHQVQAKMQITIQIRQQRRMIANNNEFESSYVHLKALVYCSSYSTEVNLTFIKDLHIGGEHPDEDDHTIMTKKRRRRKSTVPRLLTINQTTSSSGCSPPI